MARKIRWFHEEIQAALGGKEVKFFLKNGKGEIIDRCRAQDTETNLRETFEELTRWLPVDNYTYETAPV